MKKVIVGLVILSFIFVEEVRPQSKLKLGFQLGQMGIAATKFTNEKTLSGVTFGGHLDLGLNPYWDFCLLTNYFGSSYETIEGKNDYKLLCFDISLTYRLQQLPIPVKPYIGGGFGWHSIKTTRKGAAVGKEALSLEEKESQSSINVLGGLYFKPSGLPLSLFLEGKYSSVLATEIYSVSSFYLGISYIL